MFSDKKESKKELKEIDLDAEAKKNEKALCDEIEKQTIELERLYLFSTSSSTAHGRPGLFQSNSEKITEDTVKFADNISNTKKTFSTLYYTVLKQEGLFDPDSIFDAMKDLSEAANKLHTLFNTPRDNEYVNRHKTKSLYPIEPKALASAEVIKTVTSAYQDAIQKKFEYVPPTLEDEKEKKEVKKSL